MRYGFHLKVIFKPWHTNWKSFAFGFCSWSQISEIKQWSCWYPLVFKREKGIAPRTFFFEIWRWYSFGNLEPLFWSRPILVQLWLATRGNFSVADHCEKIDLIRHHKNPFCQKIPRTHSLPNSTSNQFTRVSWIISTNLYWDVWLLND